MSMSEYTVGEVLGVGLQGVVKRGVHRSTGEIVALKYIKTEQMKPKQLINLNREIDAMNKTDHPNIVNLKFVERGVPMVDEDSGETRKTVCLGLEFCSGGELFNFLMYSGKFPERVARSYFRQLMDGLQHCHERGVTHRDLKAENLLLDAAFQLKIADFGLSAKHEDENHVAEMLHTECGTRSYMAPEVFSGHYDGPPTDMWSAGIVLFIMLTGFPPLQIARKGDWWFDRLAAKQNDYFWKAHLRNAPKLSKGAMNFMDKLFVVDPRERATFETLAADPWLCGEILEGEALKQELATRKLQVEVARREEKLKKQRNSSQTGLRGHVVRGAGGGAGAGTAKEAGPAPPLAPSTLSELTALYVTESGAGMRERLEQFFSSNVDIQATWSGPYCATASVPTARGAIKARFSVFSLPGASHGDVSVLEVRRLSGGLLSFQNVFRGVSSLCDDICAVNPGAEDATLALRMEKMEVASPPVAPMTTA